MNTDPCRALDAWLHTADDLLHGVNVPTHARSTEPERAELIGKLWVRLDKERDLELHVRVGWLAGTEFVQLIDFVPSTGRYETSVMLEARLLERLLSELRSLQRFSAPSR